MILLVRLRAYGRSRLNLGVGYALLSSSHDLVGYVRARNWVGLS